MGGTTKTFLDIPRRIGRTGMSAMAYSGTLYFSIDTIETIFYLN